MSKSFDAAIERDAKSGALDRAIIRDTIKGLAETDQQAVLAIVDGMAAEIERLRAAVEESREAVKRSIDRLCAASQWQKMADAPMDGTSVLVINDRGQFVASWHETGPDYCLDQFWHVFSGKAWNDLRGSLPIAWQPLPSPPTQEGGE